MSGLVLIVGALMVAAGGYEMIVGNGDILSERGWSAFIAGSVFMSGGVVTVALGVAVRALDRLKALSGRDLAPTDRVELAPAPILTAPGAPVGTARASYLDEAPTAPVLAAPPIMHAAETHLEPVAAHPASAAVESHDDWLEQSFADLAPDGNAPATALAAAAHHDPATNHHEAAEAHVADVPDHPSVEHHDIEHHAEPRHEALLADAAPPVTAFHEPISHEPISHEPTAPAGYADEHHDLGHPDMGHHEPATEQATVSAREAEAAPTAAVIGRYESEGTSYVMYADGSIDAQSEAGVYRFASMSELKAFIES